jgi:hypothetical protein
MLSDGGLFMFLSIDMANSTEFKNHEPLWPYVIHRFYMHCVEEIKQVCPHFNVWKYIGDEVVFWRHIVPADNLARLVHDLHAALLRVIAKLDGIEGEHGIRTRNLISAKMTVWGAVADFVPNPLAPGRKDQGPSKVQNKIIREDHIIGLDAGRQAHETVLFDFVGPEIDIGFRISKFAHRGVLLVGCGLAHLLLEQSRTTDDIGKHLKIVSYEPLKGVWNGRAYPIIWYTDNWNAIDEKFYYDEAVHDPLFAKVCRHEYDEITKITRVLAETNHLQLSLAACELMRG